MKAKCDKCKTTVNIDKNPLGILYLKNYDTICLECLKKLPDNALTELQLIDPHEIELLRELLDYPLEDYLVS